MTPPPLPFAAALLAGGRSTRMKQDKALLHWHGQDLWQAQLHKLQSIGAERVLLSCRSEQPLYVSPSEGVEVVHDPEDVDEGPLGAITRCLELVQMPLLVLAVDMPWMTAAFLREHLVPHAEPVTGCFFRGPHGDETLSGLYVPAMLPLMQKALCEKHLALQPIIEAAVHSGLAVTHPLEEAQMPFFHNVNTPHDLKH
ncbi:molybdenum cofactor guanylyltransferase [Prosthecobacter vanneervenii]|uniref:Molybdopterin-guanine dinucleotide biosynthesis protein A n=1 Tax=Prosthecobacter vanneervenii TaxID=48466 RepID=A0A7W8DK50_9BACT|nr:molybdenum cofactor guanylyltransferase [Prosthecobacter vanneervenii]MBB5032690.1 molybdopterin-guanine dinucleotide biosynthesis protein A [Prosthecobacter vanneervenii]